MKVFCAYLKLILGRVKGVLLRSQTPRPACVRFPLIVSEGPKVNVSNEDIYQHVEFP
jgi:hypothetical protein